jgi:uncharacterized phage protein (TIGR02218 family)
MSFNEYEESAHEGGKVELYLFQTDDGRHKWAYTTERTAVSALGATFIPEAISRTELRQNAGQSGSERLTIRVPFDNPVAVLHVPYLPPRPIRVNIYSYQRRDLSIEIVQGFIGYVTSFSQKGVEAELLCSQIIDTFQQTVPWAVFHEHCIWATYEEGCFVDRTAFLTHATVDDNQVSVIISADFATKPDGWFTAGYAINPIDGEVRFITAHTGNAITLVHPFTDLPVGSTLDTYAGDDHTESTCRLKFNNKVNYLAFDHVPNFNVFEKGTL